MRLTEGSASCASAKLLASVLIVLMVATVVSSPYAAAVRADGSPTLVTITYSGSLNISTSLTTDEGYGGSQSISFTEVRKSNFSASFSNLTVVGMIINGSEILGGVGNATFSSTQSWSLTPQASGNYQVSLDPASGTPTWDSPGAVFAVINGSQAFFFFVPSSIPELINSTMTITDTQTPSLPPEVVSLLLLPPAVDGYGATMYATIGGQGSDLPQDAAGILSYMLAFGQLTTSDPTHSSDIPFSGDMPSQASLGGTADVVYSGDLSLTVLNVQYSTPQTTSTTQTTSGPQTTYTLDLKTGANGTTNPPPDNYTRAVGTSLGVTALPDSNYSLSYWLLDGNDVGNANPYSVKFDGNHILQPVFGPGTGGQGERTVVIDPGNYAEYAVSVNAGGSGLPQGFDMMNVVSVRGSITGVTGSVATIEVQAKFANGTVLDLGQFTTDVDSGYTSNGGFGAFMIGSELGRNEQVYTSSQNSLPNAVINETMTWTQNGFSRMAVHLKSDTLGEYFWDQGTGLLLYGRVPINSGDQSGPAGYVTYTLASTSLFSGGSGPTMGSGSFLPSLDSMTFWIGVIVVVVLIVVVLVAILRARSRRRKKEGVPPATFSKKQAKQEEVGVITPPTAPAEPVTGAPLPKFAFCPNCGRTLPSQLSKFCPFCGFSLNEQGAGNASG